MFLEAFLVNYISSVLAGVTLGLFGLAAYKTYNHNQQKNRTKQKNSEGNNLQQNIQNQTVTVYNLPPDSDTDKTITTPPSQLND